ncbi:MAG: FAD-dependent oxidoreductase [bacterium]|nr:FAD-dependent oxidoreductase [bacterium]
MKKIVILGAGTAGTIMANKLAKKIDRNNWSITLIDKHETHYYQPGFLFIPFGIYSKKDVIKPKKSFVPSGVEYIQKSVNIINPESNEIELADNQKISYDILIIATGSQIVPDEIEGLKGVGWQKNVFDFYTIEGTISLGEKLKTWEGGKLVVHLAEMPIKCPVAPLEFTFLSDWFFTKKGMRDKVDISFVTPLSGAFTKEQASKKLGNLLQEKNINLVPDFAVEKVDEEKNVIYSYDDKQVEYDLLVSIPTNMGDAIIERSGLGDELRFVPTDPQTLQSLKHKNIFVVGDAAALKSSKAGSVAHFQAEILEHNIMHFINNEPLQEKFDGHANCFIESGHGKAFLIDFNYDTEPVAGTFPVPVLGPFSLLKESRINHWGKLAFRWMYWNVLLKGFSIPGIKSKMSKIGKKLTK